MKFVLIILTLFFFVPAFAADGAYFELVVLGGYISAGILGYLLYPFLHNIDVAGDDVKTRRRNGTVQVSTDVSYVGNVSASDDVNSVASEDAVQPRFDEGVVLGVMRLAG